MTIGGLDATKLPCKLNNSRNAPGEILTRNVGGEFYSQSCYHARMHFLSRSILRGLLTNHHLTAVK